MLRGNRVEIDAFQVANIDGRHTVALRIDTFCIRMDAADRAEAMLDDLPVWERGFMQIITENTGKYLADVDIARILIRRHARRVQAGNHPCASGNSRKVR